MSTCRPSGFRFPSASTSAGPIYPHTSWSFRVNDRHRVPRTVRVAWSHVPAREDLKLQPLLNLQMLHESKRRGICYKGLIFTQTQASGINVRWRSDQQQHTNVYIYIFIYSLGSCGTKWPSQATDQASALNHFYFKKTAFSRGDQECRAPCGTGWCTLGELVRDVVGNRKTGG